MGTEVPIPNSFSSKVFLEGWTPNSNISLRSKKIWLLLLVMDQPKVLLLSVIYWVRIKNEKWPRKAKLGKPYHVIYKSLS